jgi:hypothetical protein
MRLTAGVMTWPYSVFNAAAAVAAAAAAAAAAVLTARGFQRNLHA